MNCPQETAATKAARTGQWEESLQSHVVACSSCREIVHLSRSMQRVAQIPEEEAALPEAGLVWWKAQFAQRQKEAERAQKTLEWMEITLGAIAVLVLGGGFAWGWPRLQEGLPAMLAGVWQGIWNGTWLTWLAGVSSLGIDDAVILPLLAVACAVGIFVGYPYLVEE